MNPNSFFYFDQNYNKALVINNNSTTQKMCFSYFFFYKNVLLVIQAHAKALLIVHLFNTKLTNKVWPWSFIYEKRIPTNFGQTESIYLHGIYLTALFFFVRHAYRNNKTNLRLFFHPLNLFFSFLFPLCINLMFMLSKFFFFNFISMSQYFPYPIQM